MPNKDSYSPKSVSFDSLLGRACFAERHLVFSACTCAPEWEVAPFGLSCNCGICEISHLFSLFAATVVPLFRLSRIVFRTEYLFERDASRGGSNR